MSWDSEKHKKIDNASSSRACVQAQARLGTCSCHFCHFCHFLPDVVQYVQYGIPHWANEGWKGWCADPTWPVIQIMQCRTGSLYVPRLLMLVELVETDNVVGINNVAGGDDGETCISSCTTWDAWHSLCGVYTGRYETWVSVYQWQCKKQRR